MPRAAVTVFDVAAYILKIYAPMAEKHGSMTAMKLQKLVYYCQAWSLALDNKPLFGEQIEAWVHGPVVRKLFELNRGRYEIRGLTPGKGSTKKLAKEQQALVDRIVERYGPLKPNHLTELTHQEQPWREARDRAGLQLTERGREKIPHEDMANYYSGLV